MSHAYAYSNTPLERKYEELYSYIQSCKSTIVLLTQEGIEVRNNKEIIKINEERIKEAEKELAIIEKKLDDREKRQEAERKKRMEQYKIETIKFNK